MNNFRREEIKRIIIVALDRCRENDIPVKIKKLTKSYSNIRLIPYSKEISRQQITYQEFLSEAGSIDAYTDYYANIDLYIIYYNDIDKTIIRSNRYRWNIAHELGHVLLHHQKTNKKTRIFRSSLSDDEYDIMEEEADYFASLILVPYTPLYCLKIKTDLELQRICKISRAATYNRFKDYKKWIKRISSNDFFDNWMYHYYYNFVYKKNCTNCNAEVILEKGKYCPICGQKTLKRGEGKMKYKLLETYENGKVKICPKCCNEETNVEGNYCQICGTLLVNKCDDREEITNDLPFGATPCGQALPTNARFCPKCGFKSVFLNDKVLTEWVIEQKEEEEKEELEAKINQSTNENGFMNIPDGIDEELPFN